MTTSTAPSPTPPSTQVWWRRLHWRVVVGSVVPAAAVLIALSKFLTRPEWPEAKIFGAVGSAMLLLGALAQVVAESDEIKRSQGSAKDAFVLCGWLLVITGAAFTL